MAIFCAIFFRDKEKRFRACLNDKKARINYLKEALVLLFIPLFVAIVVNFLIKSLLFVMNQEILSLKLEVPYVFIVMTYLYILVLSALGISVNFLFQVGVKSRFSAAVLPMFMFEGLILVAGVSNIFTSREIPIVFTTSNLISDLIFKYVNMFTENYRIELLGTDVYSITLLSLLALTTVFLACTCRYVMTYDEKCLNYSLRFTVIRRLIILSLVSLLTMYISIAIFGSIAMFKDHALTIDQAFMATTVTSIVLIPILTVGIEVLYMKNNNILKSKKNKDGLKNSDKDETTKSLKKLKKVKLRKSNKKAEENFDDFSEIKNESSVMSPLDENLESKGIVKETILANYKQKDNSKIEDMPFVDSKTIEGKKSKLVPDDNLEKENDFFSMDD